MKPVSAGARFTAKKPRTKSAPKYCFVCERKLGDTYYPATGHVLVDMCLRCGGRVIGLCIRAIESARAEDAALRIAEEVGRAQFNESREGVGKGWPRE